MISLRKPISAGIRC